MPSVRSLSVVLAALALFVPFACTDDGKGDEEVGDGDSTGDGDTTADTTGDGDTTETDTTDYGDCGNGVLDADEICDDGNNVTEFAPYSATACIDNCSMLLATCNDGMLDPGEDCDDGNDNSRDECTTSCTFNDSSVHAACTVYQEGMEVDPLFNISEGDIMNCENVFPVPGAAVGCNRSWTYIGNNEVYAAGGDCQMIALKCDGGAACPPGPIGDYDMVSECPDGHVLVDKTIEGDGVIVPTIKSKVCLKACEFDRDCRWNEADAYWMGPGEYRCQVTPLSGGNRVCNDARNDAP
jgi:cysteine-rich repeat protein